MANIIKRVTILTESLKIKMHHAYRLQSQNLIITNHMLEFVVYTNLLNPKKKNTEKSVPVTSRIRPWIPEMDIDEKVEKEFEEGLALIFETETKTQILC